MSDKIDSTKFHTVSKHKVLLNCMGDSCPHYY